MNRSYIGDIIVSKYDFDPYYCFQANFNGTIHELFYICPEKDKVIPLFFMNHLCGYNKKIVFDKYMHIDELCVPDVLFDKVKYCRDLWHVCRTMDSTITNRDQEHPKLRRRKNLKTIYRDFV
jgi:hypothetical protein